MVQRELRVWLKLLIVVLCLAQLAPLQADPIGSIISYQGKLTNPDRTPIADNVYNVTFTFYESGNNTGVTQTIPVRTFSGVFSTFLSVGTLVFNPANSYALGVSLNGVETQFPIASVPVAQVATRAITATTAATVADGAITTSKIAPGAVTDANITAVGANKITGTLLPAQIGGLGTTNFSPAGTDLAAIAQGVPWTSYTPTVTVSSGTGSIGTPFLGPCKYIKIGRTVSFTIYCQFTATGTVSNVNVDLPPFLPATVVSGGAYISDTAVGAFISDGMIAGQVRIFKSANANFSGSTFVLFSGTYEATT